ncbi:MAG: hypothetical protein HY742_02210 [Deltaproteobacteria bacterium]|nr:hypothetical protein [Deltaproteobacteria bacterium]
MDIEMEKEKLRYALRLDIRRMIVDKLLLGLVIIAVGFFANIALEKYRSGLTEAKFLLEKRLEAVQAICGAYSDMFNTYDEATVGEEPAKKAKEKFIRQTSSFQQLSTRWNATLSKEFCLQLNYFEWIYIALQEHLDTKKYRNFIFDLNDHFHSLCKREIGSEKGIPSGEFTFERWTFQQGETKGARAFLKVNYEKWIRTKEKASPATKP